MARSEQLSVEPGLRGRLKKNQLPYSMGNVFPRWDEGTASWWRNIDLVIITYLTPATAAAALLPSEFSLLPVRAPGLAGKLGLSIEKFRAGDDLAAAMLVFGKYRAGGALDPYN